jgi:hypothetical protein
MPKKEIKNIWGWLEQITLMKSPISSFSKKEWEVWNSYMIHRFLSMNVGYLDVVNLAQKFNPQDKSQIYSFYKEFIPKKKTWSKYIKSQIKPSNKELIDKLSSYYKVSKREVVSYIPLISNSELIQILGEMGVNEKEAKKIIKK